MQTLGASSGQVNPDSLYAAVAVRDGGDLFLVISIRRRASGDVYVNFPRDHDPTWKPHTSVHASGQRHQKSFNHKFDVKHRQKPDASFGGTENVVTIGVASDEPRKINKPCQASDFQDVIEIPLLDVRAERYLTYISVDMAEPDQQPPLFPGARILRQEVFMDSVPWVFVTVYETPGFRKETQGGAENRYLKWTFWAAGAAAVIGLIFILVTLSSPNSSVFRSRCLPRPDFSRGISQPRFNTQCDRVPHGFGGLVFVLRSWPSS